MARLSTKRQYLNPFTRSGGRSSTSLRSVRTSFAATLPAITAIGDYCSIFSNINEGDNLSTIPRVLAPSNVIALGYGTTLVTLNRIRIAGYFVLREIASNNAVDDQMELNSILIRWALVKLPDGTSIASAIDRLSTPKSDPESDIVALIGNESSVNSNHSRRRNREQASKRTASSMDTSALNLTVPSPVHSTVNPDVLESEVASNDSSPQVDTQIRDIESEIAQVNTLQEKQDGEWAGFKKAVKADEAKLKRTTRNTMKGSEPYVTASNELAALVTKYAAEENCSNWRQNYALFEAPTGSPGYSTSRSVYES